MQMKSKYQRQKITIKYDDYEKLLESKVVNRCNANEEQLSEVSTPRYSDLSSLDLGQPKIIKEMSPLRKSNNKAQLKLKDYLSKSDEKIQMEYEQLIDIFTEDDSCLQIQDLVSEGEFRNLSNQLQFTPIERQTLIYKFYNKKNGKKGNSSQNNFDSKYYAEYLSWKQQAHLNELSLDRDKHVRKYSRQGKKDKEDIRDNIINKQLQLQSYKDQLYKRNEQESYQEMKKKLNEISSQYKQKLTNVLSTKWESKENQYEKQKQMKKHRQLGFEKIQYPDLCAVYLQKQEQALRKRREQKEIQKCKEINEKSFTDLIKNPPKPRQSIFQIPLYNDTKLETQSNSKFYQRPTNMKKQPQPNYAEQREKKPKQQWHLDIQKILAIPYKKFLLFYNEFEGKLIALASPEELKRLNKYRKQALERQQAIQKLREKIAMSGSEVIYKLSPQKRDRLFKLLYEDEVDQERRRLS